MSQISFEERVLIYRAAHGIVDKQQLEQAIGSWSGLGKTFSAQAFSRHCEQTLALEASKASTFRNKLAELCGEQSAPKPLGSRPTAPTPTPPAPTSFSSPPVSSVKKSSDQVVFEFLLRRTLSKLEVLGFDKLRRDLGNKIRASNLPFNYSQIIESWLNEKISINDAELPKVSMSQMKGLMDAVYGWMCAAIGPVKADQVLARIVKQAELLPEANSFSPRRLL